MIYECDTGNVTNKKRTTMVLVGCGAGLGVASICLATWLAIALIYYKVHFCTRNF